MKKIIWLIVIVAAVAIVWNMNSGNGEVANNSTSTPSTVTTDGASEASSPSDTSDSTLINDSASIDAQMKGLDSDSTSADQGLNDKQIAQ